MYKCKIIAEVSCNHMGDMDLAKKMIDAAAESGADYVKFQTWKVDRLQPGDWDHDGRREIYEKAELSEDNHFDLYQHCENSGVKFLTSCFCIKDLKLIRSVTNEVKIPSSECINTPMVMKAIDMFDTVFISTGATKLSECYDYAAYDNVFLLHCVSTYPCPLDKANMLRMLSLKHLTDKYGYSGHCEGVWDAITAIALGARVVEKHFTIDRTLEYRDNKVALLPQDLAVISEYANALVELSTSHGDDYQDFEEDIRRCYLGRWGK